MLLGINDLALLHPERVILDFSEQKQEQLWEETKNQSYQKATELWQTYLNRLAGEVFSRYLLEEPDLRETPRLWQEEKEQINLYQWVNGTAIDLASMRLVLIPSDEDELDELRVPREWLELNDWVGHYYLAVQLDLETRCLQVLGFADYQQLRNWGKYDPVDETYVLGQEDLTEDLTVMWVAPAVVPTVKSSLASLSNAEAEAILQQVRQANLVIPRLEIPFSQWGALLSQAQGRRSLSTFVPPTTSTPLTNLRQWFQKEFEAGWQALEELLTPESNNLAMSFRQRQHTTHGLSVEGVKLIDLGVQLGHQSVALLINLIEVTAEKVQVRVQLFPSEAQEYLPRNIQLALLSSSDQVLQKVEARTSDQLIQLKRFTCPVGKGFNLRIKLGEFEWRETFVIQ
ncbi:MAG: DUF1822 family protein [Halothece sp.]